MGVEQGVAVVWGIVHGDGALWYGHELSLYI